MLFGDVSLTQTVIVILVTYLASWIIYCRYFHPLCSIPGPFLASISRVWIAFKTSAGNMEHTQLALHRKHGYLVRIAPNEVICSDPEAIQVLRSSFPDSKAIFNTSRQFTTDYYDAWAPPNNGYVGHFPARDENQHSERRRIVHQVYSMSSVLESERAIDSCTQLFCETLREFARKKFRVDLGLWMNMYAFDVLGELFYGKKFGFMSERTDVGGYMRAIDSLLPTFTIGGTLPSYLTKPYFLSTVILSPSVRGALDTVKHIENASENAVKRRKQELDNSENNLKHDMLRKMLEIDADRGEKINFTHQHIVVESHSSIFAGADTTAIAINSILYHLMLNPTAYSKLTAEIDKAFTSGALSTPIAYAQAIKLPYLKACVNEGMRLHPSVGFQMPRLVPAGGATISGFNFPEGYRVGINAAVVQYDTDVFGVDADCFRPERWFEGDALRMERTMVVFGAGPRTCIGKNISLSEIYKLIPKIMRDFRIRLADPGKNWKTQNYWFNKQTEINVYLEERAPELE